MSALPVNPLQTQQQFLPADSVRLWVDTYSTGKFNRTPNPNGAQGAWGWTVEEPNRAVVSNLAGGLTFDEIAMLPTVEQTAVPSHVTEYEILDSTRIRVVVSRSPETLHIPASYVFDGTVEYSVDLFRAPSDVLAYDDSSFSGSGGLYTVIETPAGAGGSWILESRIGTQPGAPAGPVAAPASMYVVSQGAFLSVDFAQVSSAETDVRVTVRTERFAVVPSVNLRAYGEVWDYAFRYDTGAIFTNATKQVWFNFYRSDGSYLSQLVQASTVTDEVVESFSYLVTAPADAVAATLNIRFVVPSDLPGVNIRATFGNLQIISDPDFVLPPEPPTVVDLFRTSQSLETQRGDLDAGTATLTTTDPAYDVLQGTVELPKGSRATLIAYRNNLVHPTNAELLGTFSVVDSRTSYPLRNGSPYPLTVVDLQDAMSKLAAAPRPNGYYEITRLPEVLEGAGVPWDVGNRNHSYGTEPADTQNESATALDQVALTRDAHPGVYAYIDRFGVLNVHQDGPEGTLDDRTREFDFNESHFNADAVPAVSSEDVINTVMIKAQGAIPVLDSEDIYSEATFGPYVDQASVDEFGARKEEFEIVVPYDDAVAGLITTEYLRPFAEEILSRNSQPYLKFEDLSFGVTDSLTSGRNITIYQSTVDVADLVYLTSPTAGMVDAPYRVRTVGHVITPESWVMTLGFAGQSTVASPASQPSLRASAKAEPEWIEWTKISPSAAAANITMEYRITGRFIEFRFDGTLAADVTIPASGDNGNVNITSSFPGNMRPEVGNWGWPFSVGRTAFMYVTPGGTVTWANSAGAAGTVTAGTSMSHQSPLFALP